MKAHSVGYFKSPKESPQIEDAIKTLLDDSPRGCSPLLPDYNWIIRAELNFLRRQRLMNSSSKLLELRKITTTAWGGGVIRRLSHMHFIFHRIAFRNNYAKTKARETKKKHISCLNFITKWKDGKVAMATQAVPGPFSLSVKWCWADWIEMDAEREWGGGRVSSLFYGYWFSLSKLWKRIKASNFFHLLRRWWFLSVESVETRLSAAAPSRTQSLIH